MPGFLALRSRRRVAVAVLAAAVLLVAGAAPAQQADGGAENAGPAEPPGRTGRPLPRFASLRADEVNMRTGPGLRYPIEWVYRRRNLPVEIVDEFETWRRVRDWEGTVGWVHQSMLHGLRTVRVQEKTRTLRREPAAGAAPVARAEAGVIAILDTCADGWCRLEFDGLGGWVRRDALYGVTPRTSAE